MSNIKSLNESVAEKIGGSNPKVVETVVEKLADVEIQKRIAAVVSAIDHGNKLRRELNKIKPDNTTYNADGSVQAESWTKATLENKKKLIEKAAKLEKAIELALSPGEIPATDTEPAKAKLPDYSKLYEVIAQLSNGEKGGKPASDDAANQSEG